MKAGSEYDSLVLPFSREELRTDQELAAETATEKTPALVERLAGYIVAALHSPPSPEYSEPVYTSEAGEVMQVELTVNQLMTASEAVSRAVQSVANEPYRFQVFKVINNSKELAKLVIGRQGGANNDLFTLSISANLSGEYSKLTVRVEPYKSL